MVAGMPAPRADSATVVIGASISQGYHATGGHDWPSLVERAGDAAARGCRLINRSISATRLLESYPDLPSSLSRLQEDALSIPGIRRVILTDVINDIQAVPHDDSAEDILAGIRRFAAQAHAAGVRTAVTTLTPYGGFDRWDPAGEQTRVEVNAALRSGRIAGVDVIDFDKVLADPADPSRIRPAFDSGDHLHPNDAGQSALADLVGGAASLC
ncbi:hypothetical protein GCM10027058_11630 [Microbacterium neimengense]